MRLAFRIVFGATRQIVDAAIDFDRDARFAHGEVYGVPADLVLAHDVDAFSSKLTQR